MSQVLTIKYENGITRRINLHEEFLRSDGSMSKKVLDLAYQYGLNPINVCLIRGDKVIYENILKHVDPLKPEKKVDEKDVKKNLKKQFKNIPLRKISFDKLNDLSNL